jgi:hypothetical protein
MEIGVGVEGDATVLASMSDDVLESELRGLSARVAAAMCRFLLAVAEYDRRRGWERWECHDMAGWLSWKCGISPVTARQYSRVSRSLQKLPLLRSRFASGGLSYSQVRAISRVATAATEAALVELAEESTAAQLEQIIRAYRRSSKAADDQGARRHAGRYLRFSYDDDGCLVGTFRLAADSGAALAAALQAAVDRPAVDDADADGARDPHAAAQADALVEMITAGHTARLDNHGADDSRYLVTIIAERAALTAEPPADGGSGSDAVSTAGRTGSALCHIESGPALAGETARRIACDATIVDITESPDGTVLDVGRRTRKINRRLRRALQHRDHHCQYPGCDRRRVEGHHVQHWIDGGHTNLDNLISLCPRHHHRLHEGGFRIRPNPDGRPEFIHPHGWTITTATAPTPPQSHLNWADPHPYRDGWDGTRLDLNTIIEGLLAADQQATHDSAESPIPAGNELLVN